MSQHCNVPVASADGHSPAGHIPPASYETSPLDSHVGQSEPQHDTGVPLAGHVPLGHDPPAGDE